MMKTTYLLGLATTGLMLTPRVQTATAEPDVARALRETRRALDELVRVGEAIERQDPGSVEQLLAVTEPASGDGRTRDEFLVSLRNEVSRLQMAADEGQLPFELEGSAPPATEEPVPAAAREPRTPARFTTGLDGALLQTIRGVELPLANASPMALRSEPARSFEPADYTADAIRQARLYYRAGRYAEALTVLETRVERSLEARYWTARCLERTGHVDEALEHLRLVVDGAQDEELRRRAARDLDFLTWKRDFERSRGGEAGR